MGLIPKKKLEKVQFFEGHLPPWTANAEPIGTTPAAVADLQTKTEEARAALDAQVAAKQVAQAATTTLRQKLEAMEIAGADIIREIRAKAAKDPGVYALAEIPAPATPGPVGAPGKPHEFTVELSESGGMDIKWKCTNPPGCTGVVYQVWRQVNGVGPFIYVGGSGEKRFIDAALPAGTTNVVYQLQGVRSTAAGPWAQFNVNFGSPSAGVSGAKLNVTTTDVSPKLAA